MTVDMAQAPEVARPPSPASHGEGGSHRPVRPPRATEAVHHPLALLRQPSAPGTQARPGIEVRSVTLSVGATWTTAQVDVVCGDDRAIGLRQGPLVASAARRLVAEATVAAAGMIDARLAQVAVDAVSLATLAETAVATVLVTHAVDGCEQRLVGAAIVGVAGEHAAIAAAVIEAVDRTAPTRA